MAKRKVPETSKAAYDSLRQDDIRDMYRKIMVALSAIGKGTFEDIAAHMKVERERVWKRLSEMQEMGLIYRPGSKKILKSGRNGFEWALTESHLPKTEAAEKSLKGRSVSDFSKNISAIQKTVQGEMF
jgi:predicted transcriptional regulator